MRTIINLNRDWAFRLTDALPDTFPADWQNATLPHTWNADLTTGSREYIRGTGIYAKALPSPKELGISSFEDTCVFLEIRGCNSSADVYLGGERLCHHDGGYSSFLAELPHFKGGELLCVAADNSPSDSVYPQQADFTFYGGLYRDVNLIVVPGTHFDLISTGNHALRIRPVKEGKDWRIAAETRQNGGAVRFTVAGMTKTVPSEDGYARAEFLIEDARLWDGTADPYLYSAKAELLSGSGEILDTIEDHFGCRTFRIDPKEGFFLNGRSYPLRGVSRHQDRKGLGNALTKNEHEEDMAIIRDLGANSIRLAHYQHDQYFYDLCDRYGIVAWAEIPYISSHMPGGRENTFSQMRELITQNYNHPSIAVWGLSNEITMQSMSDDLRGNHKELNRLVKQLDPDRPTVMANVMMLDIHDPLIRLPDATAYNLYFGWYTGKLSDNEAFFDRFHSEYPDVPIGFTEYGCDTNPAYHSSDPKRGDYTEEYQRVYHEHILSVVEQRPWIWCSYAWNMFDFGAANRDEGGTHGVNQKGLVTMDRRTRKDAFYLYKAHWSKEPFVHLCGRRYVNRNESVTDVTVYSNRDKVSLYVDGELFSEQEGSIKFSFRVPITAEHRIEAVSGDLRDEITVRYADSPDPGYVLRGGGILNWFDADGLKSDCYSLKDKVCEMMKDEAARALVISCVNRPGKDESDFIVDLRAHPEKLETLDITMENLLDRSNPFISPNIKRHVNAAFQQIPRRP